MTEDFVTPGLPPALGFWGKYRRNIFIGLIALAVLTATMLAYVWFFRGSSGETYQNDVTVRITAPEATPSGAEMTYLIEVSNNSNTTLTSASLELIYPRGFSFIDSTPDKQDDAGRLFNLSDMPSGEKQNFAIVGRLDGNVQEIKTFTAKLHYIPKNFRSSFVAEANTLTNIEAPDVSLAVTAPPELIMGQLVEYAVKVRNLAAEPFTDLVLRLSLPRQFSVKTAVPEAKIESSEYAEWTLARLELGAEQQYTLIGNLTGGLGEEVFVTAELFRKSNSGELTSAGRAFAFTKVKPPPMTLSHQILQRPDPFLPDQTLAYRVNYENLGTVGLNNVVITLFFETAVFDMSKLKPGKGQLQNGNELTWIPARVSELLVVTPGERGSLDFTVDIDKNLAQKLQKNPRVKTRVEYSANELGTPLVGNVLDYQIATQIHIDASARIVSGANPPAIGQSSTFEITFITTNTVNDVKEAVLLATIPAAQSSFAPESVSPAEEQAKVQFVPIAGRVQWDMNRIFALTGYFHDARELKFQISVTPSTGQSPSNLEILRDIQITGIDEFTGKPSASNKINSLTTSGMR